MSTPPIVELLPEDIARFGDDPATTFAANLKAVQARITAACQRCGRNPEDVRLLPVTKTVPAHILRLAYTAGILDFGENKLQEARDKQAERGRPDMPSIGRASLNSDFAARLKQYRGRQVGISLSGFVLPVDRQPTGRRFHLIHYAII